MYLLLLDRKEYIRGLIMKKCFVLILMSIFILTLTACSKSAYSEEIPLLADTFWNGVTKMVYYDFDEEIYEVSDAEKLEELQTILTNLTYKEIDNPWLEGWYLLEIHTKEKIYDLSITGENINFDGKSYKVNESIAKEVVNVIMND